MQETAREPKSAYLAYAQVIAVRMRAEPERRHPDTEEVFGKRSVHPGNERALIQGKPTGLCTFEDRKTRRSTTRFVHGFVHETWRDARRRGRRGETRRLNSDARCSFGEVSAIAGDSPRRQRRASYGS